MMDKEQLFGWVLDTKRHRFADESEELHEQRMRCFSLIDASIDYARESQLASLRTLAECFLFYGLLGVARTCAEDGTEPPLLIEGATEPAIEHFKEVVMEVLPTILQQVVHSFWTYPRGDLARTQ